MTPTSELFRIYIPDADIDILISFTAEEINLLRSYYPKSQQFTRGVNVQKFQGMLQNGRSLKKFFETGLIKRRSNSDEVYISPQLYVFIHSIYQPYEGLLDSILQTELTFTEFAESDYYISLFQKYFTEDFREGIQNISKGIRTNSVSERIDAQAIENEAKTTLGSLLFAESKTLNRTIKPYPEI